MEKAVSQEAFPYYCHNQWLYCRCNYSLPFAVLYDLNINFLYKQQDLKLIMYQILV